MTTRSVTIRPVRSRSDLKAFIDLPYRLYRNYPAWVPPLRQDIRHTLHPKKNAFFEHGAIYPFLARDASGTVTGRIAAIVNGMHLKTYEDKLGYFGFFETIEDYAVAEALLDAASARLREEGLTGARGPANPSVNDTCGLLVDGFNKEPGVLMPYNPPYYESFLERYGFERVMTMWGYYIHKKYVKTAKLERGVEIVKKRNPGVTLRTLDMKRFDEEAQIILDIYNDALENNWGHVPMTEGEFAQLARQMKQIVDPNIIYFVEDDGVPVGFSVSLPNINQLLRHVRNGRLLPFGLFQLLIREKFGGVTEIRTPILGVRKKYHGRGLDAILNLAAICDGEERGYDASEMSWVLDSNARQRNALISFGGVIDKEYAMMEKALT